MAQAPQGSPRSERSTRDLLWAMLPLVIVVLAVVGIAGQCSVSPGGPDTEQAVVPTVDAELELGRLAERVSFPVRVPAVPDGWRASTVRAQRLEPDRPDPQAVRTGYLSTDGSYLRLSQSSASEQRLVEFEVGELRPATGAVTAAGRNWVVYPGIRGEPAWITDLGDVRLLITGAGDEAEFLTLARATLDAQG